MDLRDGVRSRGEWEELKRGLVKMDILSTSSLTLFNLLLSISFSLSPLSPFPFLVLFTLENSMTRWTDWLSKNSPHSLPPRLTLFFMYAFALCFMSTSIVWLNPFQAASWRAVFPCCRRKEIRRKEIRKKEIRRKWILVRIREQHKLGFKKKNKFEVNENNDQSWKERERERGKSNHFLVNLFNSSCLAFNPFTDFFSQFSFPSPPPISSITLQLDGRQWIPFQSTYNELSGETSEEKNEDRKRWEGGRGERREKWKRGRGEREEEMKERKRWKEGERWAKVIFVPQPALKIQDGRRRWSFHRWTESFLTHVIRPFLFLSQPLYLS